MVLKYNEPPEGRKPKERWRLYPFKGDEQLEPLYIHRQSAYLIGRDPEVSDKTNCGVVLFRCEAACE